MISSQKCDVDRMTQRVRTPCARWCSTVTQTTSRCGAERWGTRPRGAPCRCLPVRVRRS